MSKHITREVWAAAGDFYKAAQPGDTVDEQIVNDFRDCVPPASMSSGYLQVGCLLYTSPSPRDRG